MIRFCVHVQGRYCKVSGRGGGGLRKPNGERKWMGNTEVDSISRAAVAGLADKDYPIWEGVTWEMTKTDYLFLIFPF